MNHDSIIKKIAEALLMDYTSVYYVNAVTNAYQWYSTDPEYHSLHLTQDGGDFFADLPGDVRKVVYRDDQQMFLEGIRKERLLAEMKKGMMQSVRYRLMIDGKPVWHTLRLIRGLSGEDDYFIFGVINIDKEVREEREAKRLGVEREIYNHIAASLADHYDTLYYIDMDTGRYFEFSSKDTYKSLGIRTRGADFFSECRKNIPKYVHPEDQERVLSVHYRDVMLRNLAEQNTFTMTYRLLVNGETMHVRYSEIWASDHKHIIVCLENINAEVSAHQALLEIQKKSATYGQIAESLAQHYDVIYYVNSSNGNYNEFTSNSIYGNLEMQEEGSNFFEDLMRNAKKVVHPEDMERVCAALGKDRLISALENKKQFSMDYRLVIEDKPQFVRLTVIWASDRVHFIIGVENISKEVERENEQEQALRTANELARRDELTGTKNMNAYREFEASVQSNIDNGVNYLPFALVVCDINDLKITIDTYGHKAGDTLIRSACRLICSTFSHSPVFRIGGDEFVAFLGSGDYYERETLISRFRSKVLENIQTNNGPSIAAGIAAFDPRTDKRISEVFERADSMMYEEKLHLKKLAAGVAHELSIKEKELLIPDDRRKKLDALFNGISLVSDGSYIYVCDAKYDYSRWSKTGVDAFGLPGEYMYGAGEHFCAVVHPDDQKAFRTILAGIMTDQSPGLDMQLRVQKLTGGYDLCTCRGTILRDENGDADYFIGSIRNHGIQGHTDELTGLRSLYGFFEDVQGKLHRKTPVCICMIGIGRFSEINEVYGYHFGNLVLQRFGRYLFEYVGNTGSVYRLDGTKFAVISYTRGAGEIAERYLEFRTHFRAGFSLDNRHIILDLNAGMITLDHFNVDYQTVYACLNYAYGESKMRRQGDMVEFYNDLSDENKHRIEKLYAIRASIMQGFHGFYLLYQPVVDAKSEAVVGAEALLRWRSEEYGMVPPDSFIPVLEKDPLFCDLGHWILQTALEDAQKVLLVCPEFTVNVNLSYTQLEKPDFVNMVLDTLEETGFPPEHLCLEITERCRLLDLDLLKNIVVNLRGHGIRIALDDFGTGFSSVGVVKNLPFDIIKIDRSFVQRIEHDEKERELIRSFAGVASTFGAKVCVEGVETAEMRDILQGYHVQSFQGYYYAKPLAFEEFLHFCEEKEHPDG